jgi:hypothetical protein
VQRNAIAGIEPSRPAGVHHCTRRFVTAVAIRHPVIEVTVPLTTAYSRRLDLDRHQAIACQGLGSIRYGYLLVAQHLN